MSQEGLINFYRNLLQSLDCKITEEGKVLLKNDTPITIMLDKAEKQLLLPTRDVLKHGDWVNSVGFHPTCESPVAGQSQIISLLIRLIGFKFYDTIQNLTSSIITLSMKVEEHEKLTLNQLELLKKVGSCNKNTEKLFLDVLKNLTGITGKSPLFTIRLHRGGIINDETFSRTFTLTPSVIKQDLYREIINKSHSETNRNTLLNIYKLVFPEKLSYGSNHNAMPYLMVTLTGFYEISVHLNRLKMVLDKYTSVPEISLSWHNDIKHLTSWSKQITVLRGNAGDPHKTGEPVNEKEKVEPSGLVASTNIPSILDTRPNSLVPEVSPIVPQVANTNALNVQTSKPTVVKGLGIAVDIKPNKPVQIQNQFIQQPVMQNQMIQNQMMTNQFIQQPYQQQFMHPQIQNQFPQNQMIQNQTMQNQFAQNQFQQNPFQQNVGGQLPTNRIFLR